MTGSYNNTPSGLVPVIILKYKKGHCFNIGNYNKKSRNTKLNYLFIIRFLKYYNSIQSTTLRKLILVNMTVTLDLSADAKLRHTRVYMILTREVQRGRAHFLLLAHSDR